MEVQESELLLQAGLGYMQAFSSLHGHPNADLEKAGEQTNRMYYNALAHVPYVTGGRSGDDMMMDERMKAVNEYRDMVDKMRKPEPGDTK